MDGTLDSETEDKGQLPVGSKKKASPDALETNRDSVVFEIAPKYSILDSFVDHDVALGLLHEKLMNCLLICLLNE